MPTFRFPIIVTILTFLLICGAMWSPPKTVSLNSFEVATNIADRLEMSVVISVAHNSTNFVLVEKSDSANLIANHNTNSAASANPVIPTNTNEKVEKAIEHQLKNYEKMLGAFQTKLFMQDALVIFAVFMLFNDEEFFEVPVIGIKLQRNWLYFVVPIALLFLWLRFGFLLDGLIKTRIYGWELARQMAVNSTPADVRSAASLFEDAGFLDGWFVCYRDSREHLIDLKFKWLVAIIFPAVFGILLGANHACVVAVAHIGNARLKDKLNQRPRLRACLRFLPGFMVFFIFASHALFYWAGGNRNWLELVIAGVFVALMLGLVAFARFRNAVDPKAGGQDSADAVGP